MTTQAEAAFGTQAKVDDGAGNMATIAHVGDIQNAPQISSSEAEATAHDSLDAFEEFVTTTKNGGEPSFPLFWNPALPTHEELYALAYSGEFRNWEIVHVSGAVLSFRAKVKTFVGGLPVKGLKTGQIGLKVSGPPTLIVP